MFLFGRDYSDKRGIMSKKSSRRKILDSFEEFFREPLSILKSGLLQIVEMTTENFFTQDSSVSVDFTGSKTQITVFNNIKLYNLLSMATARNSKRVERASIVHKKPEFLQLSMSMRK